LSCDVLGGTRNRNYRLATTLGFFIVRDRYVGYRDTKRLAFDHAAAAFLASQGVPVIQPMRAITGDTHCKKGDHLWEIFPVTAGRHFRDADPDDVLSLAVALAKFHRAGRDFDASLSPQKLGPRGETDPAELREIAGKLAVDVGPALKPYDGWINAASDDLPDS